MKIKAADFKMSHQIVGLYNHYGELISTGDLFTNNTHKYEQHDNGFVMINRFPHYEVSVNFDSYIEVKDVWAK